MCGACHDPRRLLSFLPSYDYVMLGKVRNFPPWPGMIVDPFSVPYSVARRHPHHRKAILQCIQFFPSGDYAWLEEKDVSDLTEDMIESYLDSPSKKSGDLVEAYHIALDPRQWREDRRETLEKSRTAAVEYAKCYLDSKSGAGGSGKKSDVKTGKGRMAKPAASPDKSLERFKTGDVVLGKVGGYLTWPGWIVQPDTAGFIEGKKIRGKTNYCVQFFAGGDRAWHLEEDIETLSKRELEMFIKGANEYFYYNRSRLQVKRQHQRMRDFIVACCAALNPRKWVEEFDEKAAEFEPATGKVRGPGDISEELGFKDERKKRKRKLSGVALSDTTTNENAKPAAEEGLDHDITGKDFEVTPPPAKRIKSETDAEANESGTVADSPLTPWPKREAEGDHRIIEMNTNENENSPSSKIPDNPEAFDVWFWRHQLQKALCNGGDNLPNDEGMPLFDKLFTKIETYEEMSVVCLRSSKIHKVMRLIAKLPVGKIPRDEEFGFRARARVLAENWQRMLDDGEKASD